MTDETSDGIASAAILDRLYEIALEPALLDDCIDYWHDTGFIKRISENADGASAAFDSQYKTHFERAQVFLQRGDEARPDLTEHLQPYDNLAAFVVSTPLRVEVANFGAQSVFGLTGGDLLSEMYLPAEIRSSLLRAVRQVLGTQHYAEKLLKVDLDSKNGSMLFRVTQLETALEDGPAALVVSTHFHWRESASALLGDVFQLTRAEQDIVRLMVDGRAIKTIAQDRNTSEGTVRGQIKSIASKMNVRGQGDIIRLAMAFSKFSTQAPRDKGSASLAQPATAGDWLETEVWKPFRAISLPDHRQLFYHDMGPPTGHPVLFSHMGSCMVRWSRSMVKQAYEHNLRVICPIRAGYGHSDRLAKGADPIATARADTAVLLESLRIDQLPFAVQGSDLPFAAEMIAHRPDLITEMIAIGGQLCLPGGRQVDGAGRWQAFFVALARNAPNMVQFAARAVMAMSRRIGPEAMLRQLCKDSPADLAILEVEEMRAVLVENIKLMAGTSTNAASAFAMEYIAFQQDWSPWMMATRDLPVQMFLAREDPTINLEKLPEFQAAYPWVSFEVLENAGLAQMYQRPDRLIPAMAGAARRASERPGLG